MRFEQMGFQKMNKACLKEEQSASFFTNQVDFENQGAFFCESLGFGDESSRTSSGKKEVRTSPGSKKSKDSGIFSGLASDLSSAVPNPERPQVKYKRKPYKRI